MATYYLLLHFWLAVGETEARIRLLSVLFGVASVVPVYFIARRLGGWLAAALAAGIFALIPYVIHYSQEARGYSLAMLIGGALTWLLLIGVERGRQAWWPWLAYGLIAALGLYVHFFVGVGGGCPWPVAAGHPPGAGLARHRGRRHSGAAGCGADPADHPPVRQRAGVDPAADRGGRRRHHRRGGRSATAPCADRAGSGGPGGAAAGGSALVGGGVDRGPDRGGAAISVVKPLFMGRYLIIVLPFVAVLAACAWRRLPGMDAAHRGRGGGRAAVLLAIPAHTSICASRIGGRPRLDGEPGGGR